MTRIYLLAACCLVADTCSTAEIAVLPLLREQEGSEGSNASTVEERVIGPGLHAIEKHAAGPAAKELSHLFAVTQVRKARAA